MNRFSIILCVATTILAVTATDYCKPTLCRRYEVHVGCDNDGEFAATCPANAYLLDFTNNFKQVILRAHNDKRNFIAGGGEPKLQPACRMTTMQWDDELASIAAFNVKQCTRNHDQCRNTDKFRYAGQNLYQGPIKNSDIEEVLNSVVEFWYDEINNIEQSQIDIYPENWQGPDIGHFTPIVAERNTHIGCAASIFQHEGRLFESILVACNYASPNMIGHPIYKKCSKPGKYCESGTNPQYPNLCGTSEKYDINKWF